MSNIVEKLREHLANTPKEQLDKEWESLEKYGNIGPNVFDYLEWLKQNHPELNDGNKKQ